LWSPKRNRNQGRNPFYDFMREVAPGDVVFSFADTYIRAVGIAGANAYDALRKRGRNDWVRFVANSGGELAAVFWRDLMPAIRTCALGTKDAHEKDVAQGHVRKFAKQLGVVERQAIEAVAELQMWVMVYEAREIGLG